MVRSVFYSFHYGNDVFRANTVRNHWVTKGGQTISGVIDKAEFEKLKRIGDTAVKNWIDKQLIGTSVTVVLIGEETLSRNFVQHEIIKSKNRGNAIIGVKIHGIKSIDGRTSSPGNLRTAVSQNRDTGEKSTILDYAHAIYDYKLDNGYLNLQTWIEEAIRANEK